MKAKGSLIVKLCLAAFFLGSVLLPLVGMLATITPEGARSLFRSAQFMPALRNSLTVALVSTLISVSIAMALAFCITRSRIRFVGVFQAVLTLPMLIPSISHGMGLIILFGTNGILTKALGLSGNIYGFSGIITGSVMYSFPVAFLMLADMLRYEDSSTYEAADVLGIPKARQFLNITLPYLRKSLISVVFAVFTMVITDYGVPLMIGGNYTTLPVMMYQEVIGLLDFGKGSVVGALLLLPAVAAFIIDLLNQDKGKSSFITKTFELRRSPLRDGVSYAFCTLVSLLVIIPIATFILLTFVTRYPLDLAPTFRHVLKTVQMNGLTYLGNSLLISVGVAIIGSVTAYITAYCTARIPTPSSRVLHLISLSSLSIPGIVLGLSYVLFFKSTAIYGTLAILVLANMIHFFASPYLMIYNTFSVINQNLEDVGATLGISRLRIITRVLLPQTTGTLVEMISYFFVNSMMTISAVSFLANVGTKPIALMITQFEAVRLLECSAFVSLVILGANLISKAVAFAVKKRLNREQPEKHIEVF